ncbi:MAG: TIGR04086 family membrane protein [Bacillota bacterium]|uniref:TIGR04086 family membrane protein n=1 Tax=Desulfurispora thermophila TaxID=265470 RepID=UPI000374B217|nr:TIGR04086 family membrane protein [Desulfurispora thermophila]
MENKPGVSLSIAAIFKGLLYTFATILLGTIILAILFFLTNWPESYLYYAGLFILTIGCATGGFTAARQSGQRGLAHGLAVTLLALLLIWFLALSLWPGDLSYRSWLGRLVACALGGSAGGIAGVGKAR